MNLMVLKGSNGNYSANQVDYLEEAIEEEEAPTGAVDVSLSFFLGCTTGIGAVIEMQVKRTTFDSSTIVCTPTTSMKLYMMLKTYLYRT
jgi:hypothetical protein